MKNYTPILALIIFTTVLSCKKTGDTSKAPSIFLMRSGPDSVYSSRAENDSLLIIFNLKDTDGDIGNDLSSGKGDIFIRNTVDASSKFSKLYFPGLPYNLANPKEGIEAICTLKYPANILLLPRPGHAFPDTAIYELYIIDKDNHESNHIITRPIYILP